MIKTYTSLIVALTLVPKMYALENLVQDTHAQEILVLETKNKTSEENFYYFLTQQDPELATGYKDRILNYFTKINPLYKNEAGNTFLHAAAEFGHTYLLASLVTAGINLNDRNHVGDCPIHLAIRLNRIQTARHLIALGARLDMPDGDGFTALDHIRMKVQSSYPTTDPYVEFSDLQQYALFVQQSTQGIKK